MIRSKTFCKFFQTQSSFPLQSFFLRKKKDFRFNLGYKLASVSFHFTNILPNKKKLTQVQFYKLSKLFFFEKWMKIDIAFLRNAINIWQKFLHTSRSYGTKNHRINKSSHHRINKSSHHQIITSKSPLSPYKLSSFDKFFQYRGLNQLKI